MARAYTPEMVPEFPTWPYFPTLARLGLALAIGLLVGIERERRKKGAGVRTFAFAAMLGAIGGLLGEVFALLALALLGVLVVLLNVETIWAGEGAEMTTSAALLITSFAGLLAGQGHTFTPTVLGITTAALLAWKQPLAGFSSALTESELRSAILLAILAFVIYPVLPTGGIDPWHLVEPRSAWITVILSTVTVTELARRASASGGRLAQIALRGVVLATAAMLIRNLLILGMLAPLALLDSAVPLALMLAGTATMWLVASRVVGVENDRIGEPGDEPAVPALQSPFSLTAALRFGLIFLALQVAGTLAQRALGHAGFYAVSVAGGVISSASATAAAANLQPPGHCRPGWPAPERS